MADWEIPRVLPSTGWPAAGITPAFVRTQVGRGQWRRIARGYVLTRPEEPERHDWAAVGLASGGASSALSGWDALRVAGAVVGPGPECPVLVVARGGANRRIGGVKIRGRTRPFRTWQTSGLDARYPGVRVVTAARALCDFGLDCPSTAAVRAAVVSAVQRRRCTPEELASECRRGARNGSAALWDSLHDVFDGVRSVAEAKVSRLLRGAPIPPFELNVNLVGMDGATVAVADVLWRELRAVLEVDSYEFHFYERDWKVTSGRHNRLTRYGLAVMHYPPSEILGSPSWLGDVVDWLRRRANELSVPYDSSGRLVRSRMPFQL